MMPSRQEEIVESALRWALEKLGSEEYPGLCYAFCEDCYELGAHIELDGQGRTAREAAEVYLASPGAYIASADTGLVSDTAHNRRFSIPPSGSYVFYDCWGTLWGEYRNWGHIGLSLGDGRVVHALGRVRVDKLLAVQEIPQPLGWTQPVYIGWAPVERVLLGMKIR